MREVYSHSSRPNKWADFSETRNSVCGKSFILGKLVEDTCFLLGGGALEFSFESLNLNLLSVLEVDTVLLDTSKKRERWRKIHTSVVFPCGYDFDCDESNKEQQQRRLHPLKTHSSHKVHINVSSRSPFGFLCRQTTTKTRRLLEAYFISPGCSYGL